VAVIQSTATTLARAGPRHGHARSGRDVERRRRFRNGAFHYQAEYFDERFLGFVREGAPTSNWADALTSAFGRYFEEWFDAHKPITAESEVPPAEAT
jgi:hypothetical protein